MKARTGLDESGPLYPEDDVIQGSTIAAQNRGALTHRMYRVNASESLAESGSMWSALVWILIIEAFLAVLVLAI